MNEKLFLKQLSLQLKDLPEEEVEEIINDYASYFAEARENGLTEEEAAKNLGHPLDIVKDIKASRQDGSTVSSAESSQTGAVIVAFGLILFNLIFVLGPVFGIIGGFIGIIVACVAFIISPLLALGSVFFLHGHLFELFFSLVLCGIGILGFPYLRLLANKGIDIMRRYIDWNIQVVKGAGS